MSSHDHDVRNELRSILLVLLPGLLPIVVFVLALVAMGYL